MAAFLGVDAGEFRNRFVTGKWRAPSLKEKSGGECVFHDAVTNLCRIYPVRPLQCSLFPFWPVLLALAGGMGRGGAKLPRHERGRIPLRRGNCPGHGRLPLPGPPLRAGFSSWDSWPLCCHPDEASILSVVPNEVRSGLGLSELSCCRPERVFFLSSRTSGGRRDLALYYGLDSGPTLGSLLSCHSEERFFATKNLHLFPGLLSLTPEKSVKFRGPFRETRL